MINAWHLLWIIPLSAILTVVLIYLIPDAEVDELIDKAEPQKPLHHGIWSSSGSCPRCGKLVTRTNIVVTYCEVCGQAIDWR